MEVCEHFNVICLSLTYIQYLSYISVFKTLFWSYFKGIIFLIRELLSY